MEQNKASEELMLIKTRNLLTAWYVICIISAIISAIFTLGSGVISLIFSIGYIWALYQSNLGIKQAAYWVHNCCSSIGLVILVVVVYLYATRAIQFYGNDSTIRTLLIVFLVVTIVYGITTLIAISLFHKHVDAATKLRNLNFGLAGTSKTYDSNTANTTTVVSAYNPYGVPGQQQEPQVTIHDIATSPAPSYSPLTHNIVQKL